MNWKKTRRAPAALALRTLQVSALVCLLTASSQPAAADRPLAVPGQRQAKIQLRALPQRASQSLGQSRQLQQRLKDSLAGRTSRRAAQALAPSRAGRAVIRAKQLLAQTSTGQRVLQVKEKLDQRLARSRARMTLAADRHEERLPARLSAAYAKTRRLSVPSLPVFVTQQYIKDPAFYSGFGVASFMTRNLFLPAALFGLGLSAPLVAGIRTLTGTPVDLAVIALRTHAKRADRSRNLWGSMKHLAREFADFSEQRRQENRALAQQLRLP